MRYARGDGEGPLTRGASEKVRFLVVVPAYNAEACVVPLVESLASQTYRRWRALFVDDASTDRTAHELVRALEARRLDDRVELVRNPERLYKSESLFRALRRRGDADDVVAIVDGDDRLAADHALERIAREYEAGYEVVWSNWRGSDGSAGTSFYLNPFIPPRQQPFVSSHLFTFRRRLFDAIEERDFQDDDHRWLRAGCDVALALPILEQTLRRKHVDEVLYVYNRDNPLSIDRQGGSDPLVADAQAETSRLLSARPPKAVAQDPEFLHGHLFELLEAAHMSSLLMAQNMAEAIVAERLEGQDDSSSTSSR